MLKRFLPSSCPFIPPPKHNPLTTILVTCLKPKLAKDKPQVVSEPSSLLPVPGALSHVEGEKNHAPVLSLLLSCRCSWPLKVTPPLHFELAFRARTLRSSQDALLSQLKNAALLQKEFQTPAKTQSNFSFFFFQSVV